MFTGSPGRPSAEPALARLAGQPAGSGAIVQLGQVIPDLGILVVDAVGECEGAQRRICYSGTGSQMGVDG